MSEDETTTGGLIARMFAGAREKGVVIDHRDASALRVACDDGDGDPCMFVPSDIGLYLVTSFDDTPTHEEVMWLPVSVLPSLIDAAHAAITKAAAK